MKRSHSWVRFGWPQPAGSADISNAVRGPRSHQWGHLTVRGLGRNERPAWWRGAGVLHHLGRRQRPAEWRGNLRHRDPRSHRNHPRCRADTRRGLRVAGVVAAREAVQHVRAAVRRPAAGDHRPEDRTRTPVRQARPRARGHGPGLRPHWDPVRRRRLQPRAEDVRARPPTTRCTRSTCEPGRSPVSARPARPSSSWT